jgi:hypothetical protein
MHALFFVREQGQIDGVAANDVEIKSETMSTKVAKNRGSPLERGGD